ncbi:type II toxin-antitoxin system VapC family toxin [Candidatus Poribacteria bacterium]|nr:type II toxin-antitoxin system VapC family toxin [Candidatus Poribacteria bacterium]
MAGYFFDTSALVKNYHPEVGTTKVEQILHEKGARYFISRLGVVETHSVLAQKVRTGVITESDYHLLRRRFLTDIANRIFNVVKTTGLYYQEAERQLNRYATARSLRTLDAIQLAVAVELRSKKRIDYFVCADDNLCKIAAMEGLSVINPEQS